MRVLPVIVLAIFLNLLSLFGCSQSPYENKPVEYEEELTRQAWMMLDTGATFDEYFPVQEEAVKQLRAGKSHEDPVAVLEQMAYFLFAAGRLDEAFPYFNEALDSLHARPGLPASECAIQLYGDLSQFYERLGMIEKAIEYSDSALEVSRRIGGTLKSDIWRFRTQIYANHGRTAEAFACLDSAYEAIRYGMDDPDTALLLAVTDAERANIILSLNPSPDSVNLAVSLLENIIKSSGDHDHTEYLGAYGQALYLQGHKAEGIGIMESALRRMCEFGDLEFTYLETRRLIEIYNAEKMYDKASALYKGYTILSDSMSHARHNLDLVTAQVKADVAAKERENMMLQKKLQHKYRQNRAIVTTFILFIITATLLFFAGRRYYLKMKRRRDAEHARRISAEASINDALGQRNSALRRIETIKSEVSGGGASGTDILQKPQFFGNNTGLFLRAFNAMYPRFADDLRRDYPSLTDTDTIFCMLIYLKHTTEEISIYLNISRASVNSARYRIRTKLKLAKEDNLDKFLQQRPG